MFGSRKRVATLLPAAVVISFVAVHVHAEEQPTVFVGEVSNVTGHEGLDAAAAAVSNTLQLTVAFLAEYELVRRDDLSPETRESLPAQVASMREAVLASEVAAVDTVIFGLLDLDDDRRFRIVLSVYARDEGEVTLTHEETSERVVDVFGAADQAAAELVGAFGDVTIEFGSISLEAEGDHELAWTVWIDGEEAGTNVENVDGVLVGERTVEVEVHGETTSVTILSEQVEVLPAETITIGFALPPVEPVGAELRQAVRTEAERALVQPMEVAVAAAALDEISEIAAAYPDEVQPEEKKFLEVFPVRLQLASLLGQLEEYAQSALNEGANTTGRLLTLAREAEEILATVDHRGTEVSGTSIGGDVQRLFDALDALYRIEIAGAVYGDETVYEDVSALYEELERVRAIANQLGVDGAGEAELTVAEWRERVAMLERLDDEPRDQRNFIIGGAGLGLAATSVLSMFVGPIAALQAEAEAAQESYDAAEEPVDIVYWREELESLAPAATAWRIGQWTAIGAGAGAAGYAAFDYLTGAPAPERIRDDFVEQEQLSLEAAIVERVRDVERGVLLVRGLPPAAVPSFRVGDRLASNVVYVGVDEAPQTINVAPVGSDRESFEIDPAQSPAIVVLDR